MNEDLARLRTLDSQLHRLAGTVCAAAGGAVLTREAKAAAATWLQLASERRRVAARVDAGRKVAPAAGDRRPIRAVRSA